MRATDFLGLGGTLPVGLRPQSVLGYKINYSVASYRVVAIYIYIYSNLLRPYIYIYKRIRIQVKAV
jgi:hypothetical protein